MDKNINCNKTATNILSLGHLTVDSYGSFITPLMPFLAAKLSISVAVASLLISISHLTSSILQPLFGYISDGIARRFFVLWGLVFASIFIPLIGLSPNPIILGFLILFGFLGIGFYHPQSTGLITQFAKCEVNKTMGLFTACGTIGYALGPVFSSFLVENFGMNSTVFAFIPGFLCALLIYKFLPKIPQEFKVAKKGNFFDAFKEIFSNKILLILTGISIVKALVTVCYGVFMPFMWKDLGYSILPIGLAVSSFSILGGVGSYFGGRLSEIINPKNVFYISLLPIVPLTLLFAYSLFNIPWLSFVCFALTGFFTMLSVSVNMVMAQKILPEKRGMISGVIGGFSWGIAGILLTPLGIIVDKYNALAVIIPVSITAIIMAIYIKKLPND